jgi:hypothetical protein
MEDVQDTASISSPAAVLLLEMATSHSSTEWASNPNLTDLVQSLRAGVWLPAREWSNAQVVQCRKGWRCWLVLMQELYLQELPSQVLTLQV